MNPFIFEHVKISELPDTWRDKLPFSDTAQVTIHIEEETNIVEKDTKILPLNPAISERAETLIDTYGLSGKLKLADALIAATALEHGLSILTGKAKHFSMIENLRLDKFVP